jgi:hypothetical protein
MRPITEAELRTFVGPNAGYYLRRWQQPSGELAPSMGFNAAAFFLSFLWILYRRMYRVFWIGVGVILLESFASQMVAERVLHIEAMPRSYDRLANFAASVIVGMFGNWWYFRHAERQIAAAREERADEAALAERGGTRRMWPGLLLGAVFVLFLLILAAYS